MVFALGILKLVFDRPMGVCPIDSQGGTELFWR
jgi:hypothetical protein